MGPSARWPEIVAPHEAGSGVGVLPCTSAVQFVVRKMIRMCVGPVRVRVVSRNTRAAETLESLPNFVQERVG